MKKGSLIGNVAQDLGLDLKRLRAGRARIVTGESIQYTELKTDKGILVVSERIDREQLCGDVTPCSFRFEILLENPIELRRITVEILDINDHAPDFPKKDITFEISESATLGSRFTLASAEDPDVGLNALQSYDLTPNDNFILKQHTNPDGSKYAEMVLQKTLDREEHPRLSLKLIAVDGGNPQRSGTGSYSTYVTENNSPGMSIFTVSARDSDWNQNARISYLLEETQISGTPVSTYISINSETGVLHAVRSFDYEHIKQLTLMVKAQDGGSPPLSSNVSVNIFIQDQNDNAPQVLYPVQTSSSLVAEMVPRSADVGYLVTKVVAVDVDSGQNAWLSYKLQKATDRALFEVGLQNGEIRTIRQVTDKDAVKQRLTVVVEDNGQPSRSATVNVNVAVADSFPEVLSEFTDFTHDKDGQIRYSIPEEMKKGSLIGNVAQDLGLDLKRLRAGRARIVTGESIQYTELKTDKGILVVSERIDREQLCGDVTPCSFSFEIILEHPMELHPVTIFIQDQNDNAPQVLYPVQTSNSLVAEMVPRSADVGYLVTKVVAVDVDSGQNAWLSYKLQKAMDRALFEVGLQNGEIRTIRQVNDKDAVKQRLAVVVEDNGQPSRSATVNVNVAVADSFPEVLSEFIDFTHDKEYNDNLTFYLVLALAVVSFLFITCLVVIISVKIFRWRQSRVLYNSNLPVIPYYPPRYADTLGTGTLQHVYNYEVCRTTDSRKSDCKFVRPCSQNVLIMDPSSTGTMQRMQSENNILDEPDSPLEAES
ncbi:protocadherin gamma-A3-like [Oncorhynchus clarkii lewisi]|uniref:protocadherin gamma-A3-like n=1 Tax=Oncorhynchus clarkii lewisi TaxID=490388 RepID=UPI0039B8B3EE